MSNYSAGDSLVAFVGTLGSVTVSHTNKQINMPDAEGSLWNDVTDPRTSPTTAHVPSQFSLSCNGRLERTTNWC